MDTQNRNAAVFVIGSPRSGTSVMAWALAQHPEVATGPEADFPFWVAKLFAAEDAPREDSAGGRLARALQRLRDGGKGLEEAWQVSAARPDGWLATKDVGRGEFLAAVGLGLERLFDSRSDGKRWVDSTPACALVGPQLAAMFPRARFVHMLRDGRAAVSSMVNSGFDVRIAKDFDFACETWARYAAMGRELARALPERCVEVRQEELAAEPAAVVGRLLPFLALPPDPRVADFLDGKRINSSWGNEAAGDVRKVKPAAVVPKTPWRDWSRKRKAAFRAIAGETQAALGYDVELD